MTEKPLNEYIDLEAYDVVTGQQYRELQEQLDALGPSAARKVEAYDAARAKVKREGLSRAEYVLRAENAEEQIEEAERILGIISRTGVIPIQEVLAINEWLEERKDHEQS